MAKVIFKKGDVVAFDDLPDNCIALDGAVQGPNLDPARRRWSFDHHAGCLRLVTKATCEQVREAICLGLPIDAETVVLTNDIDADTVISVWLLENPSRSWDENVRALVADVGLLDAHGPLFGRHPIVARISPPWGKDAEKQSMAMLERFVALVGDYCDGKLDVTAPAPRPMPGTGYGWSARTGWQPVSVETGFDQFYKAGFVLGFLGSPAPGDTVLYTVAKASDLVFAPLGPGSTARPMTSIDQADEETILGALARAEQEKNPSQSLAATWGGGTSVGGSPRNPDGSASVLTPEEVLAVFRRFVS